MKTTSSSPSPTSAPLAAAGGEGIHRGGDLAARRGPHNRRLYINVRVFFRNVPEGVLRYELGGYPVLKKWLGYRDARRRNNLPLSLPEKDHFRSMVQRITALLSLRHRLNELYETAAADAWIADLGAATSSTN